MAYNGVLIEFATVRVALVKQSFQRPKFCRFLLAGTDYCSTIQRIPLIQRDKHRNSMFTFNNKASALVHQAINHLIQSVMGFQSANDFHIDNLPLWHVTLGKLVDLISRYHDPSQKLPF